MKLKTTNIIVFIAILLSSTIGNAANKISTKFGDFTIEMQDTTTEGIYSNTYTYRLNGIILGKTEGYIEVTVKDLGVATQSDGLHSILLRAYPYGNACSEALAVLRVKKNKVYITPRLDFCGGVTSIRNPSRSSIVIVKGLERDGITKVKHVANGYSVSKNEDKYTGEHTFFD